MTLVNCVDKLTAALTCLKTAQKGEFFKTNEEDTDHIDYFPSNSEKVECSNAALSKSSTCSGIKFVYVYRKEAVKNSVNEQHKVLNYDFHF